MSIYFADPDGSIHEIDEDLIEIIEEFKVDNLKNSSNHICRVSEIIKTNTNRRYIGWIVEENENYKHVFGLKHVGNNYHLEISLVENNKSTGLYYNDIFNECLIIMYGTPVKSARNC